MRAILIVPLLCLSLVGCGQENSRNVNFFKDTKAYELAKAVARGDLVAIERLVKADTNLLGFTNPVSGSNVLVLCLYVEKFKSFKKLLELGANPNFIDPYNRYSVLMDACKPFGSSDEWIKDNRYAELLLEYGADPNYVVGEDFTNEKGHYVRANSALLKASSLNLDLVKLLIKHGTDPYKKIGKKQKTPFSEAVSSRKYNIIYYYIDSLDVNIHEPMYVRKTDSLFIQDYIVNKFTKARLDGDSLKLEKFIQEYEGIKEANEQLWELVKYLENKGVDFKNYNYKLLSP